MKILKKWYFRNYEQEKNEIDRSIVARFSRGNILVQEGYYITDEEFKSLSKKGDESVKYLMAVAG